MPEPFILANNFGGTKAVPYRFEADVYDCEVLGAIPASLYGSYYRVGGDRAYPTLAGDNVINGDGMASVFHFDGGNVDYRCRYVKTPRYLQERQMRRRLYGRYRNPFTDDPTTTGMDRDNTGNTYAFFHHGHLFALREDSVPLELDPITLETIGVAHFANALQSQTMTAHPKIDPLTGEWWSYGQFCRKQCRGEMSLQVLNKSGELVRQEEFMTPYPGVAHDFAMTREHVVFSVMPLTVDMHRVAAGGDFYAYDPTVVPMYGIMSRSDSTSEIRWFSAPKAWAGHFMNAYTEGPMVHVDAVCSPGNPFSFFNDRSGRPTDVQLGTPTFTRLTFDLADSADSVAVVPFPGGVGAGFPRLDERFAMSRYRYGIVTMMDGIAIFDVQSQQRRLHPIGNGFAQEAVFVPRDTHAAEGDGFILSVVNRVQEHRADLIVIDTERLEEEPVATVRLPFSQPFSFHGMFTSRLGAALPRE